MTRKELIDALIEAQGSWVAYSRGQLIDTAYCLDAKYQGNIPEGVAAEVIERHRA